jgi:hypothetical protein
MDWKDIFGAFNSEGMGWAITDGIMGQVGAVLRIIYWGAIYVLIIYLLVQFFLMMFQKNKAMYLHHMIIAGLILGALILAGQLFNFAPSTGPTTDPQTNIGDPNENPVVI